MKTLTITLHDTDNCGSSLQAYALQHFLLENGIDNEIIDYVPAYTQNNGNRLKTFIRKMVFRKASLDRRDKFKQFVTENLKVTCEHFTSFEQLQNAGLRADCYITGSDQLWNAIYSCGRDPAFYLDFTSGNKIAYAVSLGRDIVPEDNLEMVKHYVKDFLWVSVREETSVNQIAPVIDCKVEGVCDPVLLNPIEYYDKIRMPRLIKDPYILVYVASKVNRCELEEYIQKVKKIVSGKIVFFGSYRNKCTCDMHVYDVSPSEFLSMIFHAEYVISNSFHMTVFSMLYHKQFISICPESNGLRIREILNRVGIGDHGIIYGDPVPENINKEQYSRIQGILNDFGRKSGEKLISNLKRCCK